MIAARAWICGWLVMLVVAGAAAKRESDTREDVASVVSRTTATVDARLTGVRAMVSLDEQVREVRRSLEPGTITDIGDRDLHDARRRLEELKRQRDELQRRIEQLRRTQRHGLAVSNDCKGGGDRKSTRLN